MINYLSSKTHEVRVRNSSILERVKFMYAIKVILLALFLFFGQAADFLRTAVASEKSSEETYQEFGVQRFREPVKAPDFTMKNLEGKEIKLQDLAGKVVLLTFFTAG